MERQIQDLIDLDLKYVASNVFSQRHENTNFQRRICEILNLTLHRKGSWHISRQHKLTTIDA